MVSFTCENCGDTLKEDVAQHVVECKGPFPLTCIYCKKEFYDDQYTSHSSCVLEIREVRVPEKKCGITKETVPWSEVETRLSDKSESKPQVKTQMKSDWIRAIDRVSESPSLTEQQSSLLESLTNLLNVPKKRTAFGKFVLSHWKVPNANESVIDEVFRLIEEQSRNMAVRIPQSSTSEEPTWVAAMRGLFSKRMSLLYRRILDKVLNYQKNNPVPLSLPNQQSFQDLVRKVFKDPTIDPHVINEVFDAIMLKMASGNKQRKPHDRMKVTSANGIEERNTKRPAEITTKVGKKRSQVEVEASEVEVKNVEEFTKKKSNKKKDDRKQSEGVVDPAEMNTENAVEEVTKKCKTSKGDKNRSLEDVEAENGAEEVTKKKSKKKPHKRPEDLLEDEDVPKKKSSRRA